MSAKPIDLIRVAICDDHAMLRRGMRDTLAEASDIRVVGEAANYGEIRDLLRTTPCDVLTLDLNMPGRGGLEVLAGLKQVQPLLKTLIVSMFPEEQYAVRCLRAGAHGYLNKAGPSEELISAVRWVMQGKKYISAGVAQLLADTVLEDVDKPPHALLSERELQTLTKIAAGKKLSEIADELLLSPKTVSVYRARLMEKLAVGSNAELTAYALRNGLM